MLADAPSILTYVWFFQGLIYHLFLSAVRAILSTYSFSAFRTQCVGNLPYKHRCNRLLLSHRVRSPCHSLACSIYLYFLKSINRHVNSFVVLFAHLYPFSPPFTRLPTAKYLFFRYAIASFSFMLSLTFLITLDYRKRCR